MNKITLLYVCCNQIFPARFIADGQIKDLCLSEIYGITRRNRRGLTEKSQMVYERQERIIYENG